MQYDLINFCPASVVIVRGFHFMIAINSNSKSDSD